MIAKKTENVVGALVLGLTDAVLYDVERQAPEPGQAASAITLLRHEPGMSIERLRRALSLSHPGAVRLVDRLVVDGMIERRPSLVDRRVAALHLTEAGEQSCDTILETRYQRIAHALEVFDLEEREIYKRLTEKLLGSFIKDLDHAYAVCRLCDTASCTDCPVDCALQRKADADTGV